MQVDPAVITILMFGLMFLLMALGLPICFVLGGCALFFGVIFWGPASLNVVILNASNLMSSSILVAVPLFVFMAYMLEKSGVAEDLYHAMHLWMGPVRGGLAAGSVIGCTLIAAMSGISTTGVLMMGIIGLPAMLRRGYDKYLAMGSIMAGGGAGPLDPAQPCVDRLRDDLRRIRWQAFFGRRTSGHASFVSFSALHIQRMFFQKRPGARSSPRRSG